MLETANVCFLRACISVTQVVEGDSAPLLAQAQLRGGERFLLLLCLLETANVCFLRACISVTQVVEGDSAPLLESVGVAVCVLLFSR